MDSVEMASRPFAFVEHLWEYAKQVHQVVGRTPLLLEAFLAADPKQARGLREQMADIKNEADRTRYILYGEFKAIHFQPGGEYAVSHYVDCLDSIAESVDRFAGLLVLEGIPVPDELRGDLQAFLGEAVRTSGLLAKLADILWPSADALPVPHKPGDAHGAIAEVVEGYRQALRRDAEFIRHLHAIAAQLDPAAFQCLYHCRGEVVCAVKGMELAANYLRAVAGP